MSQLLFTGDFEPKGESSFTLKQKKEILKDK